MTAELFFSFLPWLLMIGVAYWLGYQRLLASERQTQAMFGACRENLEKTKVAVEELNARIAKLEDNA